jgi:hypothetical protein
VFRHRLRPRIPSLPTAISLLALSVALTGTAYAATTSVVSIGDSTTPANTAKVSSAGALSTSVSGSVSAVPTPPKSPFFVNVFNDINGDRTTNIPSTTATLAITHISFANESDGPAFIDLNEFDETGSTCDDTAGTAIRFVGRWQLEPQKTLEVTFPTPLVLKPLQSGHHWCVATVQAGAQGAIATHYDGYVSAGSFTAPTEILARRH